MYTQRAAPAEAVPEALHPWPVRVHRRDGTEQELAPVAGDWYVVIDELAYGRVLFEAAGWPMVDGAGRLVFEPKRVTRTVPAEAAQEALDAARGAVGQVARPLRIGDAFLVRGPVLERRIERWQIVADVTRAAREAARLALFAAVAPRLRPEQAERLPPAEPDARQEPPRGQAGQVFPAV